MDTTRLRYFTVVAETGSVRRAAELLHVSPPALSKAIKVLEQELGGIRLVRPSGRGIVLTDHGRQLARRAAPILAELAELPAMLTARHPAGPVLRYASHEVFGTYFTAPLLDAMPADGAIEHRYVPPGEIEAAVHAGDSDIGITYIPMPTAGVVHELACTVEMGTYGTARWRDLPVEAFEFAAPVRPAIGSPVRPQSLDGWPDDTVARTVRHRITTTESALELCRQGRAVARFPAFVVALHDASTVPDRRLVRLPDPPQLTPERQDVFVVHRVGEQRSAPVDWVRAALAQVA